MSLRVFNLFGDDWDGGRDRPGWRWRSAGLGRRLGAVKLGATLYELEPGQRSFPYHYEYGNEEWLLAVTGKPTLRTPEGQRELSPGEVVAFAEGSGGAHQVLNGTDEHVRVLLLSTRQRPDVAIYPDSDKFGVFSGQPDDSALFPRTAQVDYFEGE